VVYGTNEGTLMEREIILRGVRHHNLKNLSLNIPREKFIV